TVTTAGWIMNGVAFEINIDHITSSGFHSLLNGNRYLAGFSATKTNTTVAVADDCQRSEGKNPSTLNGFGDTVHLNQFFLQTFGTAFIFLIHRHNSNL